LCLLSREIYAIGSLLEIDRQQAPILKAKYARGEALTKYRLFGPEQVLGAKEAVRF